ncbi:amino acid adenylation domain-containing protein [Streptomyces sp. NPDC102274]|uniref:non-ribosomal peptide synthetase n=1 Tax=Streptomyces sp. NPDC102274 TaxID=3366151 RepID=UPI0038280453
MQGNDGQVNSQPEATVPSLFERHAELGPGRTAVVAGDSTLTYRELNDRANRMARRLQDAGVGPDTLVGICVERSLDMIVGLLAILKAGGAYVPMDPGYPFERLQFMIRDSAVPVVVTQRHLVPVLPRGEATVILLDDLVGVETYSTDNPAVVMRPDNLAYVTYTSGSTGTPKGVLVPHGGVVNLVTAQNYVSITPEDRVAALATLSFDASTFEIWGPLLNGATCVVYTFSGDDLSNLCGQVQRDAVSVLHLTSPVFRLLEPTHFQALSGVHTLLFGGDSIRSQLADQAKESFHGNLIHLYGPTEATGFATFYAVRSTAEPSPSVPIGLPISNAHLLVLGPGRIAVPDGQAGELYIGGRGVTRGYLNRPELTAERFVPGTADGAGSLLYRTGDLVRRDADGVLHFLGRLDRQIKVRGYRIELGEIESVLARHPLVDDVVVVARGDAMGDKRLDAYVVPTYRRTAGRPGEAVPAPAEAVVSEHSSREDDLKLVTDLRRHVLEVMPKYQRPASLTVISAIPLTANLKLDLERLPKPSRERGLVQDHQVAPRTDVEATLTGLWGEMLGLDNVGIDDNFFDIGGDSITAVRMAASARSNFGIRVTFRDFLKFPTIRELAAVTSADRS